MYEVTTAKRKPRNKAKMTKEAGCRAKGRNMDRQTRTERKVKAKSATVRPCLSISKPLKGTERMPKGRMVEKSCV